MSTKENNKKVLALFKNLMALCKESDTFYYKDEITPMQSRMRIFSYLYLSKPEMWNKPDALECRGIMFEIDENEKPIRIASRPMEKFFNLGENDRARFKPEDVEMVMDKMDGSLVSTFIDCGHVQLKSKAALYSSQAEKANGLLYSEKYADLRAKIADIGSDYTFNFEYTAPSNRIVVEYKEPSLTLLNVRHNVTGEYVPHQMLFADAILRPHLVNALQVDSACFTTILDDVRVAEGVEGIVARTKDGQMFKVKSEWYVGVHNIKSTSLFPNNLIYYVAESETDDLRAAYAGELEALERIELFEEAFRSILRKAFKETTDFHALHAGEDRKTYAANATIESRKHGDEQAYIFMCLMIAFDGLDYDRMLDSLKTYYLRNYKKLIPADKIDW